MCYHAINSDEDARPTQTGHWGDPSSLNKRLKDHPASLHAAAASVELCFASHQCWGIVGKEKQKVK